MKRLEWILLLVWDLQRARFYQTELRILLKENACVKRNRRVLGKGWERVVRLHTNLICENKGLRDGMNGCTLLLCSLKKVWQKSGERPRAKLGQQRSATCLPGQGQPQYITALIPGGSHLKRRVAAWAKSVGDGSNCEQQLPPGVASPLPSIHRMK